MHEDCAFAIHALADGRWRDWHGLPADCSLATLARLHGGSTELEDSVLGADGTACTRSSMNDAPLIAWHRGDELLLVEMEMMEAPKATPEPGQDVTYTFDVRWGVTILPGGEWVIPGRGLALVVADDDQVVSALGFGATSIARYEAMLRPRRDLSITPRPTRLRTYGP